MRILQICHRVPYPSKDGGSIAMYNLTKAFLANNQEVFMLAINTKKHHVQLNTINEPFFKTAFFQAVNVDTSVRPLSAFLNLFSKKSYNIERFKNQQVEKELIQLLKENTFDIIQLESIFVSAYVSTIRKYSKAKVILRSHNVEFKIWERLAKSSTSFFKKRYLNLLAFRLKKYELSILNNYDGLVAITENDAQTFSALGCTIPLTVALVGIDLKEYQNLDTEINHVGVFHIGAMDWLPNIEGVEWLINKVWIPGIQPVKNDLKLFLAGRNMPEKFFSLNRPTIVNDGEVADAKKYMASKTIMLVPLLSGGGMRVKIAEGMASGKTIISTRIGAEGIPYTENKNIVIADTVEEFTKAILHCVQEKSFCKNIAENARILAGECFDNEKIGLNLIEFYLKLLKSTQPVTKEFKAN